MDPSITVAIITVVGVAITACVPLLILKRGQTSMQVSQQGIADSVGHKLGDNSLVDQNVLIIHEIASLRESFDEHAAYDTARFRSLHAALGIPYQEELS